MQAGLAFLIAIRCLRIVSSSDRFNDGEGHLPTEWSQEAIPQSDDTLDAWGQPMFEGSVSDVLRSRFDTGPSSSGREPEHTGASQHYTVWDPFDQGDYAADMSMSMNEQISSADTSMASASAAGSSGQARPTRAESPAQVKKRALDHFYSLNWTPDMKVETLTHLIDPLDGDRHPRPVTSAIIEALQHSEADKTYFEAFKKQRRLNRSKKLYRERSANTLEPGLSLEFVHDYHEHH